MFSRATAQHGNEVQYSCYQRFFFLSALRASWPRYRRVISLLQRRKISLAPRVHSYTYTQKLTKRASRWSVGWEYTSLYSCLMISSRGILGRSSPLGLLKEKWMSEWNEWIRIGRFWPKALLNTPPTYCHFILFYLSLLGMVYKAISTTNELLLILSAAHLWTFWRSTVWS